MQLTAEQQSSFDTLAYWLLTPEQHLVIDGPAGAGKGYLLRYLMSQQGQSELNLIVNTVSAEKLPPMFATATTNEAVTSMGIVGTSTIYRATGIRPNGNKGFVTNKIVNNKKHIIIVDEASFINEDAFNLIVRQFPSSKFIWVMDQYQLAPIGSSIPHVATLDTTWINLTEVNRSKGALSKLVYDLRDNVRTKTSTALHSYHNGNDIIVVNDNYQFNQMMKQDFIADQTNTSTLCFRNEMVDGYNKAIHSKVLNYPEYPAKGQQVVTKSYAMGIPVGSRGCILEVMDQEFNYSNRENKYTIPCKYIQTTLGEFYDADLSVLSPADRKIFSANYEGQLNNLSLPYAMTVHKAQGRTINNVYVHAHDINTSWDKEMVRRLLYVAISRATTKVVIYG